VNAGMDNKSVTVLQERVIDDGSPEETIGVSYHVLRKELDTMRAIREKDDVYRREELYQLERLFRNAKESLQRNLSERSNHVTYRRFLHEHQQQLCPDSKGEKYTRSEIPTSNYLLNQETTLFSTLHRSFCVLPHQIEVMEQEYELDIYPYFRKEIQDVQLNSLEISNHWIGRLSVLAEENNALYDLYQNELNQIEIEVREYKKHILAQTSEERKTNKAVNKYDDDTSILSATERSCDDDDSEHGISPKQEEGGGGLLRLLGYC
jgi:hypothetical protein